MQGKCYCKVPTFSHTAMFNLGGLSDVRIDLLSKHDISMNISGAISKHIVSNFDHLNVWICLQQIFTIYWCGSFRCRWMGNKLCSGSQTLAVCRYTNQDMTNCCYRVDCLGTRSRYGRRSQNFQQFFISQKRVHCPGWKSASVPACGF